MLRAAVLAGVVAVGIAVLGGCEGLLGIGEEFDISFEFDAPASAGSGEEFTVSITDEENTSGGTFTWSVEGPDNVRFDGSETTGELVSGTDITSITLSAAVNGNYAISLDVENEGDDYYNNISVSVDGPMTLNGPIDEDLTLGNLADGDEADYILGGDLEINAELSFTGSASDIIVEVPEDGEIIINDGGTLTGALAINEPLTFRATEGAAGWTGILVESGGTLLLEFDRIEDAASNAFGDHPRSAIVVESGGDLGGSGDRDFYNNVISNTTELNLYSEDAQMGVDGMNEFHSETPYNLPFAMADLMEDDDAAQDYPATNATATLRGDGATPIGFGYADLVSLGYNLNNYVLTGSVTIASGDTLLIVNETTIYMEENTGLTVDTLSINAGNGNTVTFTGLDGATWDGLSCTELVLHSGQLAAAPGTCPAE